MAKRKTILDVIADSKYVKKGTVTISIYTDKIIVVRADGGSYTVDTPAWLARCITDHRKWAVDEALLNVRKSLGIY